MHLRATGAQNAVTVVADRLVAVGRHRAALTDWAPRAFASPAVDVGLVSILHRVGAAHADADTVRADVVLAAVAVAHRAALLRVTHRASAASAVDVGFGAVLESCPCRWAPPAPSHASPQASSCPSLDRRLDGDRAIEQRRRVDRARGRKASETRHNEEVGSTAAHRWKPFHRVTRNDGAERPDQ